MAPKPEKERDREHVYYTKEGLVRKAFIRATSSRSRFGHLTTTIARDIYLKTGASDNDPLGGGG